MACSGADADRSAGKEAPARAKGLAPWTIKGMLTPLGRIFALALRRGIIAENPLVRLQPEELPKGEAKHPPRVLSREQIAALLKSAPERYRPIIGVAVMGGLRQQEVLGLRWSEVDFKAGVLRVRHQLTRGGRNNPPRSVRLKTKAGVRDVILLSDLARMLQRQLKPLQRTVDCHGRRTSCSRRRPGHHSTIETSRREGWTRRPRPRTSTSEDCASSPSTTFVTPMGRISPRAGSTPLGCNVNSGTRPRSITMGLYVHEFETARRREQVGERLVSALGGLLAD
jgi:integrase